MEDLPPPVIESEPSEIDPPNHIDSNEPPPPLDDSGEIEPPPIEISDDFIRDMEALSKHTTFIKHDDVPETPFLPPPPDVTQAFVFDTAPGQSSTDDSELPPPPVCMFCIVFSSHFFP